MISKINNGYSPTGALSQQEVAASDVQKDTTPNGLPEQRTEQFFPEVQIDLCAKPHFQGMENLAAEKKGIGNMEATLRRADIENQFTWGESQMGVSFKSDSTPSETLERAVKESETKGAIYMKYDG